MASDRPKKPAPTVAPAGPEEMVIVPTNDTTAVSVPDVRAASPLVGVKTSLDIKSFRGRAMLVAARSAGDITFDERGVVEILATDWALFADSAPDEETGEIRHFVRTVLFDGAGRTYRTTSEHAPMRLADLLALYTVEEWKAGLPIVIQQRRSPKTGRTYHDIRVNPNWEGNGNGQ